MATHSRYERSMINASNPAFSAARTTIETAFFGNNTKTVLDLQDAYKMAHDSPGTIVTDLPVFEGEKIGLSKDAKILLFNDGETTGRFAGARVILGEEGVSEAEYAAILREAVYLTRYKKMLHSKCYIGLDEDFMVRAHLLIPETYENTMYNWLLNFQYMSRFYDEMYKKSVKLEKEPDILMFSDPDWKHPKFPNGLAFFDPEHNCAALLGLRYFGEHKKGTLTIAWGIANRNGYASCHGGLKQIKMDHGQNHVMGVFGLSGSGKSTITHAKHDGKYDVTILHDDAYVISSEKGSTVALEPSYFDKTQDYPLVADANKYLVTVQNCGACFDKEGKIVLVTEDIRNGNGRAIKSKLWADNRVDKMEEPITSIVWLMKDHALPPVVKINNSVLAAVMGATLATKRSSAEKLLQGVDKDALVFEPYANPFRTYPLKEDYFKFKDLFAHRGVENYIINTGHFLDKKIPKEVTLDIVEQIVEKRGVLKAFGNISSMQTIDIEGFIPDFGNEEYLAILKNSIQNRISYLESRSDFKAGRDALPKEAADALIEVLKDLMEQ